MSRKRRLSDVDLSDETDEQHGGPFDLASSDSTTAIDGDISTSSEDSSPTVTGYRTSDGRTHRSMHAPHEQDRRAIKRRRKAAGHVKFQKSFEGMVLDEQPPAMYQSAVTSSPTAVEPPWGPSEAGFHERRQTGDSLNFRDATILPDAEGDIPIETEHDEVLRPETVEQPSNDSGNGLRRENEEIEMRDAVNGMDGYGRQNGAKSWYEPEKDRIVVTSLSDTESSSPPSPSERILEIPNNSLDSIIDLDTLASSPLPNNGAHIHQPGPGGFTISPSFLSRLNRHQLRESAEEKAFPSYGFPAGYQGEKGLVMYRPPPLFGMGMNSARSSRNGVSDDDDAEEDRLDLGARIEEINDDDEEEIEVDGNRMRDNATMDAMDMDVDNGLVDDVEGMDIG